MRTLNSVSDSEKKLRKAKETMEIYAPLADRMGMNRIRDELEDLSFAELNPEPRKLIVDRPVSYTHLTLPTNREV